jgi:hypothetical protein
MFVYEYINDCGFNMIGNLIFSLVAKNGRTDFMDSKIITKTS